MTQHFDDTGLTIEQIQERFEQYVEQIRTLSGVKVTLLDSRPCRTTMGDPDRLVQGIFVGDTHVKHYCILMFTKRFSWKSRTWSSGEFEQTPEELLISKD